VFKIKNDKYKHARGGESKLLVIGCSGCGAEICLYQKDGPGLLKRLYLDRIVKSDKYFGLQNQSLNAIPVLKCDHCGKNIGYPCIYTKEKRLAFRLVLGAFSKKINK